MALELNNQTRRRGVILIEMALMLPLLLLITFAVLEYGWMFAKMGEVTNAARQGARIGVRPAATGSDVTNSVNTFMSTAGFSGGAYSISMTPADPTSISPGSTFNVVVTVPYSGVSLTGFPLLPKPANLQASVTMMKEGPPGT